MKILYKTIASTIIVFLLETPTFADSGVSFCAQTGNYALFVEPIELDAKLQAEYFCKKKGGVACAPLFSTSVQGHGAIAIGKAYKDDKNNTFTVIGVGYHPNSKYAKQVALDKCAQEAEDKLIENCKIIEEWDDTKDPDAFNGSRTLRASAKSKSGTPAKAEIKEQFKNEFEMTFQLVPAGSFIMGSPLAEPGRNQDEEQHKVSFDKPFYMQTTEVTQKQWQLITGKDLSEHAKSFSYGWALKGVGPDFPMYLVSWGDIQNFIEQLNSKQNKGQYRLPTEAEWEYACRAKSQSPFGVGNGNDFDANIANVLGASPYGNGLELDSLNKAAKIASYPPNAWGLFDMHGNVMEWTQDSYTTLSTQAVTNPTNQTSDSYKVIRGGSWSQLSKFARSAYRTKRPQNMRLPDAGFRLVFEPTTP